MGGLSLAVLIDTGADMLLIIIQNAYKAPIVVFTWLLCELPSQVPARVCTGVLEAFQSYAFQNTRR
jgi:hypothetical protein